MMWSARAALARIDLAKAGTTVGVTLVTGGVGFVLLFGVYSTLVPAYVGRREELVLKRLRTGELRDAEILAGTALPAVGVALAQIVVLVAAGAAVLHVGAPRRPDLLAAGVLVGTALVVALAAASTPFTRTVEMSQLTTMPVLLVSAGGSGLFVPLEVLPHQVADVCRLLPLSPAVDLVRDGWLGGAHPAALARDLATAVAWTALAVFAVRRRFRWEPRR